MAVTHPDQRVAVRSALRAMLLWLCVEFLFRDLLLVVFFAPGILKTRTMPDPGAVFAAGFWLLIPAWLVLGWVFHQKARRDQLSWGRLGYSWPPTGTRRGVVAAGLVVLVVAVGEHLGSRWAGPIPVEALRDGIKHAGVPALAALVVGNGLVGPVVEEFAWRGYVQRRLLTVWTPGWAIMATVCGSVLKHLIVDLSTARIVTLLATATILGVLAWRNGTWASTCAHMLANAAATTLLLVTALTN